MHKLINNVYNNRKNLIFPIGLYLVGVIVFVFINYERNKNKIYKGIDNNLYVIASSINNILPLNFYDKAIEQSSINSNEDWQNIKNLTKYAKQINASFLFTLIIKNNKVYYTSCSTNNNELKNRNEVHYWQEYKGSSYNPLTILKKNEEIYETITEKYGTYRTVLIPKYSATGKLYVLGANYNACYINKLLNKEIFISLLYILLFSLFSLPFVYIIIKSKKNYNYSLQTKVQERTVQLTQEINEKLIIQEKLKQSLIQSEKLAKKAQEADKAKEEFLTTMSHEIRTPLNVIVGVSTLLNQSKISQEQTDYLLTIKSASEHLLSIVDNILDFSLIESKKVIIEKIKFDIYDLINYSVNSFINITNHKHISLSTFINDRLPKFVVGDQSYLRQILFNLIGNAVKFTENGGVNVSVTLNNFDSNSNKVEILFKIEDTGIGIYPENEKLIFEKFSQIDSSTRRKYGGTGLGLAICKNLLDILGGKIWFESELGKGSVFYFTLFFDLPINVNNNIENAADIKQVVNLPELNILLAEDNLLNVKVAKSFLEKSGHNVSIANNGFEVLKIIETKVFDIILMDVEMPGMDGIQASETLRLDGNNTPIIALTAHALTDIKSKCEQAGMNYFITKPIDFKNLEFTISKVLNQNRK